MNKNRHRIVFNEHRGQFMAVSEVDVSQGGATGVSVLHATPASGRRVTAVGAITFTCMCMMGAVMWLMPAPAKAQVVAYRSAPGTQQPTILQTSNRVPQVNIQTPSAAGVSRNLYSQFDVNRQGMILNNSRTNAQTQLGGWVQANPWLATGSAKVILNEVYSSNPSYINGYIEVAGQRAEVVIANPAGISVSGGGFINASKATLTTGTPILSSGSLDGYRVQGGQLTVLGDGLDLTRTDYAAILTQSLQINAGVWANELSVVTGANQVDANTLGKGLRPQSTQQSSLGTAPAFALDVAQLGGMYAGKITLIGTEAGVGVRNAGTLDATAGNLALQANGWLTNTGTLQSSTDMSLRTSQSLTNNGTLYAGGELQVLSDAHQIHNGTTAAQGSVSLNAEGNISAGTTSLIAAGVQNNGQLVSGQSLNIQASGTAQLAGQTLATQALNVRGASVDVSQGRLNAQHVSLAASVGELNATASQISVAQALTLSTPVTLTTEKAQIQAQQLDVQANRWNNTQGRIEQTGSTNLDIDLQGGDLDNNAGAIVVNAKDLSLSVGALDNTGGVIGHAGTGQLSLNASSLVNQAGLVYSENDSRLQAQSIDNQQGRLSAVGNLVITRQQGTQAPALVLNNQQGLIVSDIAVDIDAERLSNATGQILSQGDMRVALQGNHTTSGTLVAKRDLSLSTTGRLLNEVSVQAGRNLSVSAQDIDNSASGELLSAATTLMETSQTLTNRGLIDGRDTRIVATNIDNLGSGRIYGDRVAIAAQTLTNQEDTSAGQTKAGTIAARKDMNLGVQNLTNRESALIYSDADLAIGGQLDTQWRATGQVKQLQNASATLEAAGNLNVKAIRLENLNPHFSYEQVLDSQTSFTEYQLPGRTEKLASPGGVEDYWVFNYTRTVTMPKLLSSSPGQLIAGKAVTLTLDSGLNKDSLIVVGGQLIGHVDNLEQSRAKTEKITTDQGESHYRWIGWCGFIDRYHCEKTSSHGVIDARKSESVDLVPYITIKQNAPANMPVNLEQLQTKGVSGDPIRTLAQPGTVPNSSLYKQHPETGARYLIETDPRFTNQKTWLGSDYMLNALNLDPAITQKRLGDGFYEQKLIREQVASLTGQRYLGDYSSDEQEYMALMNNGLTFAKKHSLRPGVALSDAQVAALTSDMVWLVSQEVTLADGSKQSVLVPQVYVRVKPGDIDGSGALLAGADVNLQISGDVINGGTISGRNALVITAGNIRNMAGNISADSVALKAKQDIDNVGGLIQGSSAVTTIAERDLNIVTATQSSSSSVGRSSFAQTGIDRIAGLYVRGANGTLLASAGRDMNITAGVVSNAGSGSTTLAAVNNLNVNTVTTSNTQNIVIDSNNFHKQSTSQDVGSTIVGGGAINLIAGQTFNAKAANVQTNNALNVIATDINIKTGQSSQTLDEATQQTSSDILSKKTETAKYKSSSTSAIGSSLGGDTVKLVARRDIGIHGSNVVGDNDTSLTAANSMIIEAAQNTSSSSSYHQTNKSGLMSGGTLGVSIGKQKQSLDSQDTTTTSFASTVGSIGGTLTLQAGEQYKQVGSDVLAPGGDVTIQAKKVDIVEARETNKQSTEQKFEQSGLTLSLSSPVLSALQTVQAMGTAESQTSDSRMKVLAGASAALAASQAAAAVSAGQGDANGQLKNADGSMVDANAADKAGGISIAISLGSSKSSSLQTGQTDTARGSTVNAGGKVNIAAKGDGQNSNLTIQGSDVKAGNMATLQADNQVNLQAAANTNTQTNSQNASNASVGIGFSLGAQSNGFTLNASASKAKGSGNGSEITFTNTHVAANQVDIKSGGDTTLKGATVNASTVKAAVGGNLQVESLQDTAQYDEKSSSAGFGVSLCMPPFCVGSSSATVNAGKTKIDSIYASVTEQSGIKAGDGGFQVKVQGNTDLKGGAITSADKAVNEGKNSLTTATLTTRDIENKSSVNAQSSGFSVSTDMMNGKYAMAKGAAANLLNNASESASSTGQTNAVVSVGATTITNDEKQKELTGKSARETVVSLNTDAANAQKSVTKQDVQAAKETVNAERAIKQEAFKQITAVTTDLVNQQQTADKKIIFQKCDANGQNCGKAIQVDASDIKVINGKAYVFNNGIMNNEQDALANAAKQSSPEANQQGVYVIINPHTGNPVAEVLTAAWDKLNEITNAGLPISNAASANIDVRDQVKVQGGMVVEVDHSRGALTGSLATSEQVNRGVTDAAVGAVTFNGGAANAQRMADQLNTATSGAGVVQQSTHKDDTIGTFVGGNAATGGRDASMLDAHTTYGPNVSSKDKSNVWGNETGGSPVLVSPSSVKVIEK